MIAIYARQSIDKKDSISIESQIEYGKHEAFDEPYEVYQDKGYSGKNTNRPAFERMLKDINDGKINKVVVYRLDRISRSIVDFADFINNLEEKHVSFVSATEKFDTSAPMGRAMLYIIIVFAQLERETIAERVKDNYYSRVKKGAVGGGPAPYGFDLIKTVVNGHKIATYTPNSNINNAVAIFNEYAKPNTSLADVQRFLASNNILTAKNKPWDNAKLSSILKSPTYVKADATIYNFYKSKGAIVANDIEDFNGENGCILVGKRNANSRKYADVSNHILAVSNHKGVIDSETFLYVQQKLSKNKQIKNLHKGTHSWLTGFVQCTNCGYSLSVRKSKCKNGFVDYFACSGRYLYKTCDLKQTHKVKDVEDQVQGEILKHIEEIKAQQARNKQTNVIDLTLKKIADIDAKIEALISNLEESTAITAKYINQRIATLDDEKQQLIEQHSKDIATKREQIVIPDYDYNNLSFDEKRELAKLLVKHVWLGSGKVEIEWK